MNQNQVQAYIYEIVNADVRFDACVIATSSTIASVVIKNRHPNAKIYYKSVCTDICQSNETIVLESSTSVVV
jgi:hypothetical protein